jgi:hypothetical protein
MQRKALALSGVLGLLVLASPAQATTVATIVGAYDKDAYDSPELDFFNTSGGTLINAQMVLTGYQGLNNGTTQTVALPDFGAGQTDVVWGSIPGAPGGTTPGNLTAYDYDDEWGNTPPGFTDPNCTVTTSLCSVVGNFSVTFTATISGGPFDGQPVFSVFSPTTNFTGSFVGWEGLDETGLSETDFDNHSGTFGGTMAIVQIGTVPVGTQGGVPEPTMWSMLLLGFASLGGLLRAMRRGIFAQI